MTTKLNLWALTTALILPLCGLAQTDLRNEGQRIERPLLPDGTSTPEQDFLFSWEALPGRSYFMVGGFDLLNLEYFPVVTGVDYDSMTHGTLTNADRETVSWQMEFSDTGPNDGYWIWVPDLDGGTWVYQDDTDARVFFVRLKYNPNESPSTDIINGDADGDGASNLLELLRNTDPLDVASVPVLDLDGDGLGDSWELQWFLSTLITGSEDTDSDGVSNATEFANGTNPIDSQGPSLVQKYYYDEYGRLAVAYVADETIVRADYRLAGTLSLTRVRD